MADRVVRFTKVVHKNGPLSKRFVLKAGQLEKSVVAAFTEGYFETVPVHGAAGFADYIRSLQPNEALCFSRCHAADAGLLTTQKNLTKVPGSVARTKQFFSFKIGEPGWLTLDHDPAPNAKLMSREELWSILCEVIPNLQSAGIVWWPRPRCRPSERFCKSNLRNIP